uniref:Uncharacterized protein n=1 Tax=Tetranychus urticae TaxID=32264 RepID=T1KA23_TETUR
MALPNDERSRSPQPPTCSGDHECGCQQLKMTAKARDGEVRNMAAVLGAPYLVDMPDMRNISCTNVPYGIPKKLKRSLVFALDPDETFEKDPNFCVFPASPNHNCVAEICKSNCAGKFVYFTLPDGRAERSIDVTTFRGCSVSPRCGQLRPRWSYITLYYKNKETKQLVLVPGSIPFRKLLHACTDGPRTATNVYRLTEWSPTWVERSDVHLGEGKVLSLPKLQPFNRALWRQHESAKSTNNFKRIEWKFSCRWCGMGTDDKSNINKHEKRCNVVRAPGHGGWQEEKPGATKIQGIIVLYICKRTKAATKNLMKISADEKPDFTALNRPPRIWIIQCQNESFQFITKCCLELCTATCAKARWNNIKLAPICSYFSSNIAKNSVEDLTKDLKFIAAVIKTKMGEECLSHYKKKKGERVMTFCNVTEMYVLNLFQPNCVVGAKETVCDHILGCRAFKEGILSCNMELNSSSDPELIRITIDNDKLLKYLRDKTKRLDMSRYTDMDGFWLCHLPEKTDTASEGSNPERHNAGH